MPTNQGILNRLLILSIAPLSLVAFARPAHAQDLRVTIAAGVATDVAGTPVSGALVEMVGATGLPSVTLGDGSYFLIGVSLPDQSLLLRFSKAGYIQTPVQLPAVSAGVAFLQINAVMKLAGAMQTIDTTATTIVTEGTTKATVEPGDLVDADANPATGVAQVSLTPIDPSGVEIGLFPGFNATKGGTDSLLESYAAVEIAVLIGGRNANIASGKTLRVEFPIPDSQQGQFTLGQTLVDYLWSLNETTGVWEEGLSVVVEASSIDPSKKALFGEVPHLSRWNCDRPVQTTCIRGRVIDMATGQGAANAIVEAQGTDYNGTSKAVADENGEYCMEVKRDATINLSARAMGFLTPSLTVATQDTAATCQAGTCQEVDDLVIDPAGRTACISGTIYNRLGLPPIPPAVIFSDQFTWTQTDVQGRYCMPVRPATAVKLVIVDPSVYILDGTSESTEMTVAVPDQQGRCGQSEDECTHVNTGEPITVEDLLNCGQCGAGLAAMAPAALIGIIALRRRRKS